MADRPTGWSLVGLPGDPVPVEPETLRKFRKYCSQREDDAWRASNRTYRLIERVEEAGLAGDWKQALLGRLAFMYGQLESEARGHQLAGEALDAFLRAARPIQERADEALEKARMETGRMSAALRQVAEYDEQKKTLEGRGGRADPWDLRERGRQQESAEEAADRLSTHYRAAQEAKTDFEGVLATFLREMRDALKYHLVRAIRGDVLPPDTMPGGGDRAWWETALHYRDQVKGILDGTLETAAGITAQTLDGATDIGAELTLMMVGMRTPGGPGAAWALAGDRTAVTAYSGSYAFGAYGATSLDEGRLYAKTWIQNTPEGQRPHRPPPPDRGPGRWSDDTRESMSVETAEAQEKATGVKWPWSYEYGGKRWDNYEDGHLVDAKASYSSLINKEGRFYGFLEKKEVDKAKQALKAAGDEPVRYVVTDRATYETYKELFRRERLPIDVVHKG